MPGSFGTMVAHHIGRLGCATPGTVIWIDDLIDDDDPPEHTEETKVSKLSFTQAISIAAQAGVPVLAWGLPGVGKSRTMESIGMHLGWHVETVIASLSEPTDFAGIPYVHNDELVRAAPAWAKRILARGEAGQHTLLFLDEITTCAPAIQAALLRVVLDKVVGDIHLPHDKVSIVAAANPPEVAAGGWDLAPPLLNRFFHLEWQLDHTKWIKGMTDGFDSLYNDIKPLPLDWEEGLSIERSLIARFIARKPDALLQMPKATSSDIKAYPTPRSWDMASRLITAGLSAGITEVELLAQGAIGQGASLEYLSWRKSASSLCDPEELLSSPTTKVPHLDSVDKIAACGDAVVAAVLARPTRERTIACWHVLYQLWEKHSKKLDTIVKPASRLAANTAVRMLDCFKQDNQKHQEFITQLSETMEKYHGIKVK